VRIRHFVCDVLGSRKRGPAARVERNASICSLKLGGSLKNVSLGEKIRLIMEIVPAILTSSRRELDGWLEKIKESGKFERVQIDFIDGEYANNLTVKPEECDLTRYLHLMFDAHLMVVEKNIATWKSGAEKVGFDRIIAQVESISDPSGFKGLALDVHSPVEVIEPYLSGLEVVVVMAVEPGFGGQEFDSQAIKLIERLSSLREQPVNKYKICVDGGVYQEHLPILESAGADEVAVGVGRVLDW
jgi:ribulose-phosphate 3-epimerase